MPRLNGSRTTAAPAAAAASRGAVRRAVVDHDDVDRRVEGADLLDDRADRSLLVERRHDRDDPTRSCVHRRLELEQPQDLTRAVGVRVLVEHALSRARTHRRGRARVVEQRVVRLERAVGVVDDDELLPGSNQRSSPLCGFETIAAPAAASSNGRHVDDPSTVACARRVMLRLIRAAEIARAKTLNGTSPSVRAAPTSPWKSRPPSAKSIRGSRLRLAHERLHPLAPELVAVAVEEDVVLLLDLERPEELRIRRPEDGLGATRAELEQPGEPALGVREQEVVLRRDRRRGSS